MNINKTLLDLDTVYCSLTHVETIEFLAHLNASKEETEDILAGLRLKNKVFHNEICCIEEQLTYLRKNIRTVEDTLLCHESKVFDRMRVCGITVVISLN